MQENYFLDSNKKPSILNNQNDNLFSNSGKFSIEKSLNLDNASVFRLLCEGIFQTYGFKLAIRLNSHLW